MFNRLSDPADLPLHIPAGLLNAEIRFIVTARDSADDAFECSFTALNVDFLPKFWASCYANFGHDSASRIIIVVNEDTPLVDPDTGNRFRKTSFLCVEDGRIIRFHAEDARDFLRETDRKTDLPQSSLTP